VAMKPVHQPLRVVAVLSCIITMVIALSSIPVQARAGSLRPLVHAEYTQTGSLTNPPGAGTGLAGGQPAVLRDFVRADGRSLIRGNTRFDIHGVNYYPKDFAWDHFWINYPSILPQIDRELDLARDIGINTVRFFLPYKLFNRQQQNRVYLDYLQDFVNRRLQPRNMVAIATLFDFYTQGSLAPYSQTDYSASQEHINTIINTLGVTNTTILGWDIKNEIDRDYAHFDQDSVKSWATTMISSTRQIDRNHLITIGFYGVEEGTLCYDSSITNAQVYNSNIAAEFASLVDFVSMHYFLSERCFENDLKTLQTKIGNKPIVLEEFGLHSLADPAVSCQVAPNDEQCDDPHTEREQVAYYNALLSLGEAYGVAGTLFWSLTDFSYILEGSQQSHHCQGILRNSNVGICEVKSPTDYSEKPAAETVRRHYAPQIAYLDLFDGWVDPLSDAPPAGWADNWKEGGALMRGYNLSNPLWSHDQGNIAFAKVVTNGTSITGQAISPELININVDLFPFLVGEVFSYSVRIQGGSDADLHVKIQEDAKVTQVLTISHTTSFPHSFVHDLRKPPTSWSGAHTFRVILTLEPFPSQNGYAATYEFNTIAVMGHNLYLPVVMKSN